MLISLDSDEFKPISERQEIEYFAILNSFAIWWRTHHDSLTTGTAGSKFRAKLKKLTVERDFPSRQAYNAYMNPDVEDVTSSNFRFSVPDLGALRKFCDRKMGYNQEKVDGHLMPILKSLEAQNDRSSIRFYLSKPKA